jgi:hypothetical protein
MYTEAQRTAPSELGYIFPDAQVLYERREACLSFRIIGGDVHEHTKRRIRSPCCARAASGHAATPPPTRVMKSRRLMGLTPRPRITDEV